MRSALSSIQGVNEVDVDYDAKTATVHFEPTAKPATKKMIAALEGAGFGAAVNP